MRPLVIALASFLLMAGCVQPTPTTPTSTSGSTSTLPSQSYTDGSPTTRHTEPTTSYSSSPTTSSPTPTPTPTTATDESTILVIDHVYWVNQTGTASGGGQVHAYTGPHCAYVSYDRAAPSATLTEMVGYDLRVRDYLLIQQFSNRTTHPFPTFGPLSGVDAYPLDGGNGHDVNSAFNSTLRLVALAFSSTGVSADGSAVTASAPYREKVTSSLTYQGKRYSIVEELTVKWLGLGDVTINEVNQTCY